MLKLVSNKIRCKFCGDVIESFSVHDFKRCRCGKCSTDGGLEYAQRSFFTDNPEDTYEDLSVYIDENNKLVYAKDALKEDIPLKPIGVEIKEVSDEPKEPEAKDEEIIHGTTNPVTIEAARESFGLDLEDIPAAKLKEGAKPAKPIITRSKK